MSNTNTGGLAFPAGLIDPSAPDDAIQPMHTGMTLRDYFAAKAMEGFVAGADPEHGINLRGTALWAYKMADAMLEARSA